MAVRYALQSGHRVTAYVRNARKITEANENLTIIQGDICDEQKMIKALAGQEML